MCIRMRSKSIDGGMCQSCTRVNHPPKPAVSDQRGNAEQCIPWGLGMSRVLTGPERTFILHPPISHRSPHLCAWAPHERTGPALLGRGPLGRTKCSGLRKTQVERLVGDEASEEQVRVVVEPVEELELIETQQHLCYIFIYACHVCGKARLASVASGLASSLASKSSE